MAASIRELIGARLDAARVEASFEIMGIDTQLIEDGTYFVVECERRIAGCGGWSRRATMSGATIRYAATRGSLIRRRSPLAYAPCIRIRISRGVESGG